MMIHDHKELKPFRRLINFAMGTKEECTPAMKELISQRSKTTRTVRIASREAHAYRVKRQYLEAQVKENPKAYPVWPVWMKETDLNTALKLIRKAEEVCSRQVVSNILQFIIELKEVEKIAQEYGDIFSDLNHMCDWTARVTSRLNAVKDILGDPWCHLTAEAVIPEDNDLRTFRKPVPFDTKSRAPSTGWRSDIVYDSWEPKNGPQKESRLPKIWPNSRLKVVRPPEIQPDSCQSPETPEEIQPESCQSPLLARSISLIGSGSSSPVNNIQNE